MPQKGRIAQPTEHLADNTLTTDYSKMLLVVCRDEDNHLYIDYANKLWYAEDKSLEAVQSVLRHAIEYIQDIRNSKQGKEN